MATVGRGRQRVKKSFIVTALYKFILFIDSYYH